MTKPGGSSLATAGLVEMHNVALLGRGTGPKTSLKKKKIHDFSSKSSAKSGKVQKDIFINAKLRWTKQPF